MKKYLDIFFKPTQRFLSIIIVFSGFIPFSKAETYELLNVYENEIEMRVTGMNLCGWTGNTWLYTYINDGETCLTYITTSASQTYRVPYKGKTGLNKVSTTTVVCGGHYGPYDRLTFTASALSAPKNVKVSNNQIGQLTISWESTTKYADADVQYEVLNATNNSVIKTVNGSEREAVLYPDAYIKPGVDVELSVRTILTGTDRVSSAISATGRIFGFNLTATTANQKNVTLSWITNPEYMPGGYLIKRDGTFINGGAIIDKGVSQVTDDEGIPGKYYTYTIISKDHETEKGTVVGRIKPDGKIEGYVKTPLDIAVGGVMVKAIRQNVEETDTIQSEYAAVSSTEDGKYVIANIYYGEDESEFKVFPVCEGHMFDPDTVTRKLEFNTPTQTVNFKDTTSLTISGIVMQDDCPLQGVSVMVLGGTMPYETRNDGSYDLVVSQPGIYTIKAQKTGHGFFETYNNVEILRDTADIDFTDTSKVLLSGYFTASCNMVIGTAKLHFFTDGACIDTSVTTDAAGYYELSLPINSYNVELSDFESSDEYLLKSDDVLDYFKDTTLIHLDSLVVNDSVEYNFQYHLVPKLKATFIGEAKTCDEGNMIMKQGNAYQVVFNIEEIFNGNKCSVDTGYLVIEQELTSDQMETDTIWFGESIDTLNFTVGIPNIIPPYLNTFKARAYVGKHVTNEIEENIIIIGHRPRASTFTTVSPEVPFLILHDPPGDGSYSYYRKASTYTSNFSISGSLETSVGVKSKIEAGVKVLKGQFVYSETKFTLGAIQNFGLALSLSRDSTWETEVTTTEGYSTASDESIIGNDGDLYIGGALNIIYAVTDVISYDYEDCEAKKYQSIALEPDGFNTTFVYTESHITDVLIPGLRKIRDLSPVDEKLKYDKQINEWQQIVDNNHKNIENAEVKKNISFNGGTTYSSSIDSSSTRSMQISSSITIKDHKEIYTEFGESGNGANIGAELDVNIGIGLSGGTSKTESTLTEFTLTDDDFGDYISVDIMTDLVYGTPAFKLRSGTTSCPWEEGTQPREGVQLRANKYFETVSDPNGKAVFELQLSNTSQSDEDNTYNLIFDATSNPYGALVTIGGSPVIGNVPTPYQIPAGGSVTATVTVQKAPYSNQLKNLRFILESACDGNISDDVLLNVEFETDCGKIVLTPEQPQPLITSSTSNTSNFTLSGYTKENLISIIIERRTEYSNWESIKILTGDDIGESETDVETSFEYVEDGVYFIRAVASCVNGSVATEDVKIVIDRLAPLTTMLNPLNLGTLETGDVIYALFNENIEMLNSSDISMYNKTTGTDIPFQYGVTYNKLILLPDHSYINDGDSVFITVKNVQDEYGNSTTIVNSVTSGTGQRLKATTSEDSGPSWIFNVPNVDAVFNDPAMDSDGDGIINSRDMCIFKYNPMQEDMDDDGIGDACDDDIDGDRILNSVDNCALAENSDQNDMDGDGIGDICDDDMDGDGILNVLDNCPDMANPYQDDLDLDGIGNTCDDDMDGDGIVNSLDNCPKMSNALQEDENNNGTGDVCELITGINNEFVEKTNNIATYPNPFSDILNFSIYADGKMSGSIKILDITGKNILISRNINIVPGKNILEIKTGTLNKGIYLYEVRLNGNRYINKIVKN